MAKLKIFIALLLIVFTTNIWPLAQAQSKPNLNDIAGHWAYNQINYLVDKGAISGYSDGSFKPDSPITRAEFITVCNRTFNYSANAPISFRDVSTRGWYFNDISRAVAAGYIGGYNDNTMRPANLISRQEAAVILASILKLETTQPGKLSFTDAYKIPSWSSNQIAAIVKAGRMNGYTDGSFRPDNPITRAESAVVISGVGVTKPVAVSYNVKDYGAKGDGITDDSKAIQAAAIKARDDKATLIVPSGNYLLKSTLRIYSSMDCKGKFILENSPNTPSIIISRWGTHTKINPGSVAGLTKGATKIPGLYGSIGGTVLIRSSEPLIDRRDYGPSYSKNETCSIVDNNGTISPALGETYTDLSRLTIISYAYEQPITISGLNVELVGNQPGNKYIVFCVRSNVTLDNPVIINTSKTGSQSCGLSIYDSINVTVNNPVITNFMPRGGGYGLALGTTANVTINNGKITQCSNHAITGRYDKNVVIKGGYYSGLISAVDSHWGHNFLVEDATIVGDAGVTYAGSYITIRNARFIDCINIFTVRTDTPEISGSVILDNINASARDDYKIIYAYRSDSAGSSIPDYVSMSNVKASIPVDGVLYYALLNPDIAVSYKSIVNYKNISITGGIGKIISYF